MSGLQIAVIVVLGILLAACVIMALVHDRRYRKSMREYHRWMSEHGVELPTDRDNGPEPKDRRPEPTPAPPMPDYCTNDVGFCDPPPATYIRPPSAGLGEWGR